MGDQYYNISLTNDGVDPIRFETNETAFEPFLTEPQGYEVGVKRFKLPIDSVDLIRIYEKELMLGYNLDRTNRTTNPEQINVFDLSELLLKRRDPVTGKRYAVVHSQAEFVRVMNGSLNEAMSASFPNPALITRTFHPDGSVTGTTAQSFPETTATQVETIVGFTGVQHVLQWAAAPGGVYSLGNFAGFGMGRGPNYIAGNTDVASYLSRKVQALTLELHNFSLVSGEDIYFSSWEMYMSVLMPGLGTTTNKLRTFCMFKGALPQLRLSQFATYFPHGVAFDTNGALDPRTYDVFTTPIPTTTVTFMILETDRVRDEVLLSFGEYNKVSFAGTTRIKAATGQSTTVQYDLYYGQWSTNQPYWLRGDGVFGQTNSYVSSTLTAFDASDSIQGMPRFIWDDTTQRISLAVSPKMLTNGITFYVNEGLRKILGFDSGPVPRINTITSGGSVVQNPLSIHTLILHVPTSTLTLPAVLPNSVAETLEVYSENHSSVYAREWLWGLEILSNSLAITGEFSGNGKERQKILSDFEIDPMLLAGKRDNLIYQPSGNSVRFFQINTASPLSTMQISARYVSRAGHSYPLMLSPGMLGTVKIQFRSK